MSLTRQEARSTGAIEKVRSYVLGQEEHHRSTSYQEEYVRLLKKDWWNMTTGICGESGRFSRTCRRAIRFAGTTRWFRCAAPPANFFAGLRPGEVAVDNRFWHDLHTTPISPGNFFHLRKNS